MNIGESVNLYRAYYCLDCGVCTGSCPVSRVLPTFSPRLVVEKAMLELGDELLGDRDLWSCLTCGRCYQRCPTNINFPEFMRNLREEAAKRGL
ncbi:MAG: 4Fe-4S dicluster domain-containing protein, partial [Deltaproteobacteria bacterium]|nr:4Fe-4S dicluster domain-containing protein [Deltaproteobacteria bacterium]